MSRFDFILKHVPETKMEKADRLSKRLDWKVGVKRIMTIRYLLRTIDFII